jgi:hypothetical protein
MRRFLGPKIVSFTPISSLPKEKKEKRKTATNLVDPVPLYDLQIAVTCSTGHNI